MSPRTSAPRPLAWIVWTGFTLVLAGSCGGPDAPARPVAAPAASAPSPLTEAPPAAAPSSATATLPDLSDPSWNRVQSRAGTYEVLWRSRSGKIPRNEDFELEAWVLRDGAPARDALLEVSAWMPDHGHGMLRRPRAELQSDGSFRVEGMLLHMRGHWQLFFELLEGTLAETAECAVDL